MQQNKYRFFFWQNMLNAHEAGYIRFLSNAGFDCTVVFQSEILAERSKLGVEPPDYGMAKTIHCPPSSTLPEIVFSSGKDDVHFFTGIRAFDLTRRAFDVLTTSESMLLLISESRRATGIGGAVRYLSSWLYEGKIRKRIDGVLAMGDLGVNWFNKTGYPKKVVFPFCYSVNFLNKSFSHDKSDAQMHLAFVGALIDRKNPLIILESLEKLKYSGVKMHWFGTGPLEPTIKKHIKRNSFSGYEHVFHGAVKNSDLRVALQSMDAVILPSKWDGWGAVINEALMAGCRVIASDHCGASSVINGDLGRVFRAGDSRHLAEQLREIIQLGPLSLSNRNRITNWAKCIDGDSVAKYILDVISYLQHGGMRPDPMWSKPCDVLFPASIKLDSKLKVAIAYHFFPNYRKGLLEEIRDNFDTTFYGEDVERFDGIPALARDSSYKFFPICNYRLGALWFQPKVVWASLLDEYDVFIYLANPHFITTWLAALISNLRGKRVIFWGHGFKSDRRNIINELKKIFFSLADAVFLYGYNAKKFALNIGMSDHKLYVGFNSLDYKKQLPLRLALVENDKTSIGDDVLKVLCISRLTGVCRYELLFEALHIAKIKYGLTAEVVVIGDGPERESLEAASANYGVNAHFIGAQYDDTVVSNYIYSADVVVSPGKVGLTAIHSMMFGTPVISHDDIANQMPEVESIVEGFTGMLFDSNDAASLSETLYRFKNTFRNRKLVRDYCFAMVDSVYNPHNQLKIMRKAIEGAPADRGDDASKLFANYCNERT